ncbi:MAG: ABC transporter permease [Armatimonadota bacterium]
MLARIRNSCLALLLVPAFGAVGWRAALAIGSPAVADGIDVIVIILLGMLAGWALLALLPSLRHLPAAGRNWRAGIALPVLMKEMRPAVRGVKMPALMLSSAGLAIVVGGLVLASRLDGYHISEVGSYLTDLGAQILRAVFLLGALLVLVLAPALTAGAISGEREKGTLEMLLLTRMSPEQIVWGKLLSGLSVLGLILLCALPVAGVGVMLGGVAGWQLPTAVGMLTAAAVCFGAVGLWCSARFRKTAVAVTVAYLLCLALVGMTPLATLFLIPMLGIDSGSLVHLLQLPLWLLLFVVVAASILLFVFILSSLRRRFSCTVCRTGITLCALIFMLGSAWLLFIDHVTAFLTESSTFATQDWSEYIEYVDPILAAGILLSPSEDFSYGDSLYYGVYASFDEDWPIILSNLAVFLLVAKLMLTLTRRHLRRLRQPEPSVHGARMTARPIPAIITNDHRAERS